jgi:hypothetical protein
MEWDTIMSEICTSSVELDSSNIVYDTSYTIGIWIRSHDDSSGFGTPVPPTDSSTDKISIHVKDSKLTGITNKTVIDSAWFINDSNSIRVQWHVDLSAFPKDKPYFSGITYSIGENLDNTLIPMNWDTISSETCSSSVDLDSSNIVFDTSYVIGIWILGYDDSIKSYTTIKPTDSSTYVLLIHDKIHDKDSNLITITNQIAIDSAWFDNDSNSIRVHWHANLSKYPEGKKYSSGITYSIGDTLVIPERPSISDLETISSEKCTSSIELDGSDLVFDTIP